MGNLTKFMFSLSLGTGTFLPTCVIIEASLLQQEVSCLLLATSSHTDIQRFVQRCGELGQGNDPIKSYAEQHQTQVLTRQFPNAAQMFVLVKEGFGPG